MARSAFNLLLFPKMAFKFYHIQFLHAQPYQRGGIFPPLSYPAFPSVSSDLHFGPPPEHPTFLVSQVGSPGFPGSKPPNLPPKAPIRTVFPGQLPSFGKGRLAHGSYFVGFFSPPKPRRKIPIAGRVSFSLGTTDIFFPLKVPRPKKVSTYPPQILRVCPSLPLLWVNVLSSCLSSFFFGHFRDGSFPHSGFVFPTPRCLSAITPCCPNRDHSLHFCCFWVSWHFLLRNKKNGYHAIGFHTSPLAHTGLSPVALFEGVPPLSNLLGFLLHPAGLAQIGCVPPPRPPCRDTIIQACTSLVSFSPGPRPFNPLSSPPRMGQPKAHIPTDLCAGTPFWVSDPLFVV